MGPLVDTRLEAIAGAPLAHWASGMTPSTVTVSEGALLIAWVPVGPGVLNQAITDCAAPRFVIASNVNPMTIQISGLAANASLPRSHVHTYTGLTGLLTIGLGQRHTGAGAWMAPGARLAVYDHALTAEETAAVLRWLKRAVLMSPPPPAV